MNQDLQNLEIKVENDGTTPQGRLTATEWNILVAAVKSLDLTGGSADAASILQVVANAGYATQEWVTSQKYITSSAFDNLAKNLVTLDTTQAIKGMKDFTNGLKIGGVSVYKSKEGIVFVDGNLAVRGAITMYADDGQAAPSIWDGFPYDDVTIKRNAAGKFYAVGGGGSGTGGSADAASILQVVANAGYATQDWVTGKGYITSSAIPTSLKNPNALSWSGYSSGSYDGSTAQSITIPNNTNQLTNGAGFITGITSSMVTNALGYTPVAVSIGLTSADNNAIGYGYYEGGWPEAGPAMVFGVGNYKAGVHIGAFGSAIRYGYTAGTTSFTWRTILDDNNYSNYALPLTGGTVYGNILVTGAITMYYSSDERLKKNIRKVDASKTLMSLGGVYQYEYIGSEVQKNSTYGGSHFGLIYQNVKGTALDKMCFEREDGMGALNYLDTNFISLIAGATMEHCTEIEKLKKENKALRKRVEQLEKRIA